MNAKEVLSRAGWLLAVALLGWVWQAERRLTVLERDQVYYHGERPAELK